MKLTPAFSQVDLNFWLAVMNAWYSGGGVDALKLTFSMLVKAAISGSNAALPSAVADALIVLRSATVFWIDSLVGVVGTSLTIVESAFAHTIASD